MLLLRPQCCTVAAAVVSHERFRTVTTTTAAVLLLRTPIGTVAVVTPAVLRRGPRDITAGATAATAGWKLQGISSGAMTGRRQVGSHERFSEHVENDGHLNKQL